MNNSKKVFISSFLAGCLEMYDFVIFGFLAPVINTKYLSHLDATTGLIITYALFAVGFLFRPLGSLIFGYIGDVYGRKPSIILSVTCMGGSAFVMFLLPTYEMIGGYACYIIALVRIIQGISVGGEYNGVTIYAIEHFSKKNIGFIGATVTAGSTLGVVLATLISQILTAPSMPEYSWRFAFLFGFGLSVVGLFIRTHLNESPIFIKPKDTKIPLIEGATKYKKEIIIAFLVSCCNNANFYFSIIFVPDLIKNQLYLSLNYVGLMMTSIMLVMVPICGFLSDRVGRNNMIVFSSLCIGISNTMFLETMEFISENQVLIYAFVSATCMSSLIASTNVFAVEIFPPKYRCSLASLSYSLGAALLGGTTPMILTYMGQSSESFVYIIAYMAFVSVLGIAGGGLKTKNLPKRDKKNVVKNESVGEIKIF